MRTAKTETKRRLSLADKKTAQFADHSKGIILAGSVAYSPNHGVTADSDLDLIILAADPRDLIPYLIRDESEAEALRTRAFEGYCLKRQEDGIDISLHIISEDAFEVISKCYVADIRVYRETSKPGRYTLFGFEGQSYEYHIKNIPLDDLKGRRTIVPISFINRDRYFIGIHRDKLLSNPITLHDPRGSVARGVDNTWRTVAMNLWSESNRKYGRIELSKMNILNALSRKDKMTPEVVDSIARLTEKHIAEIR